MFQLQIPFPPSVNTYWGFRGSHRFLTAKAKAFKAVVASEFRASGQRGFGKARLHIDIRLHAPDKRARDIDNVVKSTLDALTQAGVFVDDSQVDVLHVQRLAPIKGGMAVVKIIPIPLLPPL